MLKAPALSSGCAVAVTAPSSPVRNRFCDLGMETLKKLGYVPVPAEGLYARREYLAGEAPERFRDLQAAFSHPRVRGVWTARGGYGANTLLPFLSRLKIREPRVVIGSSDSSYLLWYLLEHHRLVVFYGPMVCTTLAGGAFHESSLLRMLTGNYREEQIPGRVLRKGSARGVLTGGCLTNLVSLIGTPYFPRLEKRIVLLEDVNERPYRLDRLFWQLSESGVLKGVRGIVLGEFPGCFRDEEEREYWYRRVLEMTGKPGVPILTELPLGHGENVRTVPLGVEAVMEKEGLVITEKGVAV